MESEVLETRTFDGFAPRCFDTADRGAVFVIGKDVIFMNPGLSLKNAKSIPIKRKATALSSLGVPGTHEEYSAFKIDSFSGGRFR